MENPEEVLQSLDEFAKLKPKDIPRELEEYLCYVAKTGDPVYQWSLVKCLFREKLLNVITDFYETCPSVDLPPCPNVDPFNYETMKRNLLERLDSFVNAPFTVQRLCELLTTPRKEYSRVDKFMRAIEKNILVVSTREPGNARRSDVMQPDFLMNGVMDGRSIDIGEAIETVSSDGVNLMHGDDAEVNISENETIRIDCAGAEEIDMDDHPDVEAPTDVWEKGRDTNSSECVKGYEGNDSDGENESKIHSEVDNPKDIENESKEPDSPDLETEGFGEAIESEHEENVDSTTRESNVTEPVEEAASIGLPEVCEEAKSDAVEEKVVSVIENGSAELSTTCVKDDLSDDDALKAKPPEDILSSNQDLNAVEKSTSRNSVSEVEEQKGGGEQETRKDDDSVAVQNTVVSESGDIVEDIPSLESVEEVPSSESNAEVSAADTSKNVEVTKRSPADEDKNNALEPAEEEHEPSTSVDESESQEQMEVDDVGHAPVVVQGDEPMDQSEQLASES